MRKPNALTARGRQDFTGRLHRKLGWGWELWTDDGYDVITPCNRFHEIFNLEPELPVLIHRNQLWLPDSALKTDTEDVLRQKFRVNGEMAIRLALNTPFESHSRYTSISAVHAHTHNEMDLRPRHATRQRNGWKRWYKDQPVRIRIPVTELTTVRIDMLGDVVARVNACPTTTHPVLPCNTVDDAYYWLQLAFAQLGQNTVLSTYWNTHTLCGLRYHVIGNNWTVLQADQFSIVNVCRGTEDAALCSAWLQRDGLPYPTTLPPRICLTDGYLDDLTGSWYPPE